MREQTERAKECFKEVFVPQNPPSLEPNCFEKIQAQPPEQQVVTIHQSDKQ